ncbi:MAG: cyanophycinase [Candidatus Aminicenantes bacterium]|nr:cyanophycinase [Candidatus Aminicenantes bacterium]
MKLQHIIFKNIKFVLALLLIFIAVSTSVIKAEAAPKGYLFIIGGGNRPESMMQRFVDMASRVNSGRIVVLPMASATPDETGRNLVEEFKNLGAKDVAYYNFTRAEAEKYPNARLLAESGGIFFSGGVQTRITEAILDTPIHQMIKQLYEQGAVIGGTSAGAAVMSELMITGDERRKPEEGHEFETIESGNIVLNRGLGLIKTAIIDQHFATRKRHNRLISVIAGHPELVGVGIDESTAIIVSPDQTFLVIGEKNVIIYDPSKAKVNIRNDRAISIRGMIMHVLLDGERYDLKKRRPL